MVDQVDRVLEELGWGDGFHVPVSDEANKAMEKEIEAMMKHKAELTSEMESLKDHLESMAKHSLSLDHEHKENQGLVAAYRNQIESLDGQYRLTVAEKAKTEQEARQAEKLCKDTEERNHIMELESRRRNERVSELKHGLKWDKDALLAWEEEVARSDGDNTMLMKYMQEDDSKEKSLELHRQQLAVEVGKCRDQLDRMMTDLTSRGQQLEKTAVMYRGGVKDRRELIDQWERTVLVLRQRDNDIKQARDEMTLIRSVMRGLTEELTEQKNFAASQGKDNHHVISATDAAIRQAQALREQIQRLDNEVENARCEIDSVRRQMREMDRKGEQERGNIARLKKEARKIRKRKTAMEAKVKELKQKQADLKDKTMSTAERAKHYEDSLAAEEKRKESLSSDLHSLQNTAYKLRKQQAEGKELGERVAMDIGIVEVNIKKFKARQKEVTAEIARQDEIKHNLEFKISAMQTRIDRLTGDDRTQADIELLETKVTQLEAAVAEKAATTTMLTNQLARLEEDMRHITSSIEADQSELQELTSKRNSAKLMAEGSEKRLRAVTTANERLRADMNVLKLRVKQKEREIEVAADRVFSLEKQKLELDAALRERELELEARYSVLKQKKRALLEERSKLSAEIAERKVKTEQVEKRCEIAEGLLGRDEDGEQLTVTSFKIKMLQEKLLLQEQGDELDGKIRCTEKEIIAMENTLKVVNCSNDAYKRSLACVGADDPEYQVKRNLEAEFLDSLDRLRLRKSQLAQLDTEKQNLQRDMEATVEAEEAARTDLLYKQQAVAEAERVLSEQNGRLERAAVQLRRLQKTVRADSKNHALEERDVETRELTQQNMCALQRVAELVAQHAEAAPVITRHLAEKQLSLPQALRRPQSTTSTSDHSERQAPAVVNVTPVWPTEGMPTAKVCGSAASLARRPTPHKAAAKAGRKSR